MRPTDIAAYEATQNHLFAERRAYVKRVAELGNDPKRASEVDGYLRLIDGVNAALLRLARHTRDNEGHINNPLAASTIAGFKAA